ncbi:MAG: radical SAM protein [Candidatus Roizmanbacteria bacterium]
MSLILDSYVISDRIIESFSKKKTLFSSQKWLFDSLTSQMYVLSLSDSQELENILNSSINEIDVQNQSIQELIRVGIIHDSNVSRSYVLPKSTQFELWVQVVNHCNLACTGCATGMDIRQDFQQKMEINNVKQYIKKIFSDAKEKGFVGVRVKLGGGEPTLSGAKWIDSFAEEVKNIGDVFGIKVELNILTNGVAINDALIQVMKNHDIRFSVSLDPERIVPNTTIETLPIVLQKLKLLADAKIKGNAQFTIYKNNCDKLSKLYEEVSDMEIPIAWSIFRVQDVSQKEYNKYENIIDGLEALFISTYNRIIEQKYCGQLSVFDYLNVSGVRDSVCGAGDDYVVLDTNGDIYTCHENIRSRQPLAKCSDSINIFNSIREKFLVGKYRMNHYIEGNSLFDIHGGKGCHWARKIETGSYANASMNTQKIYQYVGKMLLHLQAVQMCNT